MRSKAYVLDTNILLQDLDCLYRLSDSKKNLIVIPETVLLEMEEMKKRRGDLRSFAREFIDILSGMKRDSSWISYIEANVFGSSVRTVGTDVRFLLLSNDTLRILVVSPLKYISDEIYPNMKTLAESNDKRIIETALLCDQYYRQSNIETEVVFLSLDGYARIFAASSGISVESPRVDPSGLPDAPFFQEVVLDNTAYEMAEERPLYEITEKHDDATFSYLFINKDTGDQKSGIVLDGYFIRTHPVAFTAMPVLPMNLQQRLFSQAVLSDNYDILVANGRDGSGKTLISVSAAIGLVEKGLYSKIVYIESSPRALEKRGSPDCFSGNNGKIEIRDTSLYAALEIIERGKRGERDSEPIGEENAHEKAKMLLKDYHIEALCPEGATEQAISGAVVILDEWQNASPRTTQLILSQMDEACKVIVIGSSENIDNFYLRPDNNGLSKLLKEAATRGAGTTDGVSMFAIDIFETVRGKFVRFTDEVFRQEAREQVFRRDIEHGEYS